MLGENKNFKDQKLILTRIIPHTRGKWKLKYQELRKTMKSKKA